MKNRFRMVGAESWLFLGLGLAFCFALAGCNSDKADPKAEAPPPATVVPDLDANNFKVDHPEQFPLVTAVEYKAAPALNVTGVVQPDITRAVPVISLAAGRVVEVKARLGDTVKKGQLLMKVQSNDVSGAYQTYLKAENDERLARMQLERQQILYDKGAVAKSAVEQAEDCGERCQGRSERRDRAVAAAGHRQRPSVGNCRYRRADLRRDHRPAGDERVRRAGTGRSPNPFTISDLSYVWIICDVYENDLDAVHVGEYADIHLNAYPGKVFKGRIDNILPVLDPNLRTAKVRLEVANPGMMRIGMFVTATFYGKQGGDACRGSRPRHSAFARSRVGLCAGRARAFQAAGSGDGGTCFPAICRKLFRASSPAIRWCRTLWRCRTRWSNR